MFIKILKRNGRGNTNITLETLSLSACVYACVHVCMCACVCVCVRAHVHIQTQYEDTHFFIPELRECIYNDTKHNIEANDCHNDEEGYIKEKT